MQYIVRQPNQLSWLYHVDGLSLSSRYREISIQFEDIGGTDVDLHIHVTVEIRIRAT
jgi:hypothetical protein